MSLLGKTPESEGGAGPTPGQLLQQKHNQNKTPAAAGPGWSALSEYYSDLAEKKSGRGDLDVHVYPGAGESNPGFYNPKKAHIALEGDLLPKSPELMDTSNINDFGALATLHGVYIHECGHATHTHDSLLELANGKREHGEQIMLLEEIRMESRVNENLPRDSRWLRAASRQLLLTAEQAGAAEQGSLRAAASVATLTLGRVTAGTVREADVKEIRDVVESVLPQEVMDGLQKIWDYTCDIEDGDMDSMLEAAEMFNKLLPVDESEDAGSAKDFMDKVAGAMGAAGKDMAKDAVRDLANSGDGNVIDDIVDDAQDQVDPDGSAGINEGAPQKGLGAPSGASPRVRPRQPTSDERRARKQLADVLTKVRWRDRHITQRLQVVPPGRLHIRGAITASVETSQGGPSSAKPWKRRVRKQVEMPRLRMGILVDTSGSMGHTTKDVASAMWVLSQAVDAVDGETMGIGFGDTSEVLMPHKQVSKAVLDFGSNGGTAYVYESIKKADEDLKLSVADSPRLLVVLTDGDWMDRAMSGSGSANAELARLMETGCAVILVGIGCNPTNHPASKVCKINDTKEIVTIVGKACVDALKMA